MKIKAQTKNSRTIGTNGKKSGMRNGQLPGITGKQAKTHGNNGIKGDKIHYIEVVAITE